MPKYTVRPSRGSNATEVTWSTRCGLRLARVAVKREKRRSVQVLPPSSLRKLVPLPPATMRWREAGEIATAHNDLSRREPLKEWPPSTESSTPASLTTARRPSWKAMPRSRQAR